MRKNLFRIISIIFVCAMLVTSFSLGNTITYADEKVIKVGYDSNSKFIEEADGEFYGYGVEYLDKIAEYTHWEYEYVNDDSWQESLDKLRNGEIDLICTAHYTEERAEEFIYADIPLGYETTLLYTTADSHIFYQDYEALEGSDIGLLKESYSATECEEYLKEHGISCNLIYFNTESDMVLAIANGRIDVMAIGSRYSTPSLQIVDRLGANAFYCITNKENADLIEEIGDVLQEIMFDDPLFEGTLNSKYFGHEVISSSPLYTKEELEYIESLGTIKVKIIQNQAPSCYIEDGETKGIWAEVIKLLAQKSGIDLVLEGEDFGEYSKEAFEQYLTDGYLLFRSQKAIEYMSELEGTVISNPIAEVSLAYVKRQAAYVEDKYVSHVIATTKDLAYLEPLLLEENPDYEIKYFSDVKSCLEALKNKEAGMVVQNSHRVSYLMQKPEYADKLVVVSGQDHGSEVCLVGTADQEMLINIINKAIYR